MTDSAIPTTDATPERAAGFGDSQVILKPRKARPFFGRHPWVLDSAVVRVEPEADDGDVVDLLTDNGKFIARGIFNGHSRIRVRLYTWDNTQALDRDFLARPARDRHRAPPATRPRSTRRRRAARVQRSRRAERPGRRPLRRVALDPSHRSGHGRAGSMKSAAAGRAGPSARHRTCALNEGSRQAEGIKLRDRLHWGANAGRPRCSSSKMASAMASIWREGQKTGFYLDQRDNRRAAAGYFRGRRVLDMFCYSGGFGLNASIHGGAHDVLAIDSSQKAVALAAANAEINGVKNVTFRCFRRLQSARVARGRAASASAPSCSIRPSSLAAGNRSMTRLMAYHRLNRMAVDLLEPGGILVTCSCSGHVSSEDFLYMLLGVAEQTGRDLQVLEMRGAAADHPLGVTCLETEYLKCFICRVV